MTEPERLIPSTLGFGRRIRRRYIAPAAEQGQPAPEGEPLVPMGFVRRPRVQVGALRPPGIATQIIERAVEPAVPVAPTTSSPAARSTENAVAPTSETVSWPELPARTTVEPVAPFVPAAPEASPERAAPAGETPVRRAFTLDEVRRALQRPARTPPTLPPVQREERQPAQSDEGGRRGTQAVQGDTAGARPRPVSRLVEQPQQPVSREQPFRDSAAPSPTLSPVSGNDPTAPTAAPHPTEGSVSRRVAPTAGAVETASASEREGTPRVRDDVRQAAGDGTEPASTTPFAAQDTGDRLPGAAAGRPRLATDGATDPSIPRTLGEPGEQPLAQTLGSTVPVYGATSPEDQIQRATDVGMRPDASPPVTPAGAEPTRESFVTAMPPTASLEARQQQAQLGGARAQQPPAPSPAEHSQVAPGVSNLYANDSDTVTPEAPLDVPPEPRVGQEIMPESAAPEIRRSPGPGRAQASAPGAAVPSVSRAVPPAPKAPDASPDLASAYRAQLARYGAESQAAADADQPDLRRGPATLPEERATLRLLVGPSPTQVGPSREPAPDLQHPSDTYTAPPRFTGAVRREAREAGTEPSTHAEPQVPPATYDGPRPLQRQPVPLDQALGVLSAPNSPAVQPALPVRRSVTQGDTSRAGSATEAAPAAASPTQAPAESGPDIDELAERVYVKLRGRLRVERERLGGTRIR